MLLIVLSICLAIFAVAILVMTAGKGVSERLNLRVAALVGKPVPADYEEIAADIRRSQPKLSGIPWINRWLTGMNLTSGYSLFLHQSGVTLTLGNLLALSVAGSALPTIVVYFESGRAIFALLAGVCCLPLPFCYLSRKRAKRLLKLEQQLPDALAMMAGALRVGHSLSSSLGAVAQEFREPIAGEMRKCFEEQNFGVDHRTALINLTERVPVQDFRILVAAMLIQRESGGNLAELLDKLAQTTRERFRLKKQISIHTAQGRMTGWILSLFPVVLGFALYFVNPGGMSVLWTTQTGLRILYGAAAMDVVGALIIRKIVRIRV